jgi:hypothetical protein
MTKLWSGEVRPFYELSETLTRNFPTYAKIKTIYLLLDKWLAWTTDVDVVTGFTTLSGSGRIYYTGDGPPKQTTYALVHHGPATPVNYFPIGVVGPTDPPTVSISGAGSGDPIVRDYVYTFYTYMDEESVPSPPSALISVETGQSVIISDLPVTFGTDIREIRLYRTINGVYTYVNTLPMPVTGPYTDSATDIDLAGNEPLQSQHYYPPPQDIQGLIGLSCGSLAAFHGNKVVFSEPYQPGAWPPEYEKVFDYPVVALGTYGQTCVVATTGYTYLVSGNDPRSFGVSRVPDPYPCVSKKSMVSSDNGVIYSSTDGLIFVGTPSYYTQGTGTHVLTRNTMTHDEWQKYNPKHINGVIFDGRYYGFYPYSDVDPETYRGAGFIFDSSMRMVTGVVKESEFDKDDVLVDLDFYATATFANPQVPLHLILNANVVNNIYPPPIPTDPPVPVDNRLYQWEGSGYSHPYIWRSKQFSFPYLVTFSAAKIIFEDEEPGAPVEEDDDDPITLIFRLLDGANGGVVYERVVNSTRPFRLPSLRARTEWMVEVEGVHWVQMIKLSSSYADLQEGKAL